MSEAVIAVDVGGTRIKAALLNATGIQQIVAVPSNHGAAAVASIEQAITQLLNEPAGSSVCAIGLVVPGIVDQAAGIVVKASNLGWENLPLVERIGSRFGLPVHFGHDVRAAALAEYRRGAGQGTEVMVFTALGTGISAAVVHNGELVGAHAGEMGHGGSITGELCACGGRGCLETYASAAGIARRYSQRSGNSVQGALEVLRAKENHDPIAAAVWDEAIFGLAGMMCDIVQLLDNPRIVIGGGLSLAGEQLFVPLCETTQRLLTLHPMPTIVPSAFADLSGIYGAAELAR